MLYGISSTPINGYASKLEFRWAQFLTEHNCVHSYVGDRVNYCDFLLDLGTLGTICAEVKPSEGKQWQDNPYVYIAAYRLAVAYFNDHDGLADSLIFCGPPSENCWIYLKIRDYNHIYLTGVDPLDLSYSMVRDFVLQPMEDLVAHLRYLGRVARLPEEQLSFDDLLCLKEMVHRGSTSYLASCPA